MTSVLRDLVSKATPGPWRHDLPHDHLRSALVSDHAGVIVCDPYGPNPQDARLIALAPDLALLVADMADYLREEVESCGDSKCGPCRTMGALLARVDRLTEDKG